MNNLPSLTSLRFFAAVYVVLHHYQPLYVPDAAPWLASFLGNGAVAVAFFFVLSGFILTYSHREPLDAPGARQRFWFYRFARIYPVYLIALLLYTPFIDAWTSPGDHAAAKGIASGLGALTLTQSWVPQLAASWNPPAWSLSAEAFFYACFPLLLGPIRALTPRGRGVLALVMWVLAALPHVALAWVHGEWNTQALFHGTASDLEQAFASFNPLLRLPEFVLGVVLGVAYLERRERWAGAATARWLPTASALLIVLALALPNHILSKALTLALVLPLVAGLGLQRDRLSRLLAAPWLVLLGEASYSMYILHMPVREWFEAAGRAGLPLPADGTLRFVLYLVLLTALSIVMFVAVERPLSKGLRHWWQRRQRVGAATAAGGARTAH